MVRAATARGSPILTNRAVHAGSFGQWCPACDPDRNDPERRRGAAVSQCLAVREYLDGPDGDSAFGRPWLVGLEPDVAPAVTYRRDRWFVQCGSVENGVVGPVQFGDDRCPLDEVLGAGLDECGDVHPSRVASSMSQLPTAPAAPVTSRLPWTGPSRSSAWRAVSALSGTAAATSRPSVSGTTASARWPRSRALRCGHGSGR